MGCEPKSHSKLHRDVIRYCHTAGFITESLTYHDNGRYDFVQALRMCDSPTAMAIRTREDGVAVHASGKRAFRFDCKTNDGKHPNMSLELFPLYLHMMDFLNYEDEFLYIYRDDAEKVEGGFWMSNLPLIDRIIVPASWAGTWIEHIARDFIRVATLSYGQDEIDLCVSNNVAGSGDPFVVVLRDELDRLFDWMELIDAKQGG